MPVVSNWTWWTYFLVDGVLASGGRILEHDVARRWLRYVADNPRREREPAPSKDVSSEEYKAWRWLVREGTYQRLWVDTHRRSCQSEQAIDSMLEGVTPEGFVELADGVDPRDYFGDEQVVLASYLPGPRADS